jgi:membrane-bound ClpP family serine protease
MVWVLLGLLSIAIGLWAFLWTVRHRAWSPFRLVGADAEASETFVEKGHVYVFGELWRAASRSGVIERGDRVRILAVGEGMVLEVEKIGARDSVEETRS